MCKAKGGRKGESYPASRPCNITRRHKDLTVGKNAQGRWMTIQVLLSATLGTQGKSNVRKRSRKVRGERGCKIIRTCLENNQVKNGPEEQKDVSGNVVLN